MKLRATGKIVYRLGKPQLVADIPPDRAEKLIGIPLDVEIRNHRDIRSLPQNSKLHAIAQEIAAETGHDVAEIKTYCKRRAMKRGYPAKVDDAGELIYSPIDGEPIPESSARVTKEHAAHLIEELYALAAELGMVIA